ncbi:hypothetical protein KM043_014988 [Ampulex compressa]|nr:hypothetical protein KM043_014988 [Ampulex compressa]
MVDFWVTLHRHESRHRAGGSALGARKEPVAQGNNRRTLVSSLAGQGAPQSAVSTERGAQRSFRLCNVRPFYVAPGREARALCHLQGRQKRGFDGVVLLAALLAQADLGLGDDLPWPSPGRTYGLPRAARAGGRQCENGSEVIIHVVRLGRQQPAPLSPWPLAAPREHRHEGTANLSGLAFTGRVVLAPISEIPVHGFELSQTPDFREIMREDVMSEEPVCNCLDIERWIGCIWKGIWLWSLGVAGFIVGLRILLLRFMKGTEMQWCRVSCRSDCF